ncbi:MAG: glycosyltransferase family 2 protein [Oscillospiraceae bacterium]
MVYKISVIIPVYNSGGTLWRAIDSVRAQTLGFESIELILADDCSSDGSGALVDGIASRFPNIKSVHTDKNSGSPGTPRNFAIPLVTAPYIMFLDDDDALEPRGCELLYETAESSGADVVSGSCRAVSTDNISGFDPNSEIFRNDALAPGFRDLKNLTEDDCLAFCIGLCTKLYRTDIVRKYDIRFADGDVGEDNPFLYIYTLVSDRGYIVRDDVFIRTARAQSLSRCHNVRFYTGIPRAIGKGLASAKELGIEERYSHMLGMAGVVEHMLDCLLADGEFQSEQLTEIITAWQQVWTLAQSGEMPIHSGYAKILTRCVARGDIEGAVFCFSALRELFHQRREQIESITGSR